MNANVQRQKFRRELDLRRYLEGDGVIGAYLPFMFSIPIPIGSVPMAIVCIGTSHWVHHCSAKRMSKQINNDEQARPMPPKMLPGKRS